MTRMLPLLLVLVLAACSTEPAAPTAGFAPATPDPAPAEPTPAAPADPDAPLLTVYKSPTCGCCASWVTYMEREGYRVETRDVTDLRAVKDSLGVPPSASSCHTGVLRAPDGSAEYVVEGHVPAEQVDRLLAERPDALGLAVPNMPIGSPGMEQGDFRQPYDVYLLEDNGGATVWASIPGTTAP